MLSGRRLVQLFVFLSVVRLSQVTLRCFKLTCPGSNEVFLPEGIAPRSGDAQCDNLADCPKVFFIAPAGCYCRPGYARNCEKSCVPTEHCEKPLCFGPNERYVLERERPTCDPYCGRLDRYNQCKKPYSCHSPMRMPSGCYCIEGAARNGNGTCIPMVNCPMMKRRCFGTNEIFLNYNQAPRCDAFCEKHSIMDHIDEDEENNGLVARSGCYCREGYYRNENFQCVERKFCKVKCPGENEIFLPAGSAPHCENRCLQSCSQSCLHPLDMPEGCYCKRGYCKAESGMCVKEQVDARCKPMKDAPRRMQIQGQGETTYEDRDQDGDEQRIDDLANSGYRQAYDNTATKGVLDDRGADLPQGTLLPPQPLSILSP